jgi:hypothetical protein
MGLTTGYDAGSFKPNYKEDTVFSPDIAYRYRGDIKAAVAFALGLLLALFTTSNPAKGEERVLSFSITYHLTITAKPCWLSRRA